mgnify:CR=1 FL=1
MKKIYDKWDRLNLKNNLPRSFGTKLLNVTEQFASEEEMNGDVRDRLNLKN